MWNATRHTGLGDPAVNWAAVVTLLGASGPGLRGKDGQMGTSSKANLSHEKS